MGCKLINFSKLTSPFVALDFLLSLFPLPQAFSFPASASYARYRIRYRRPQDFFTRSVSVSPRTTQYTLRFLQFGASYNFTIRAELRFSYCFTYLYGDYSDPVNATTRESGSYIFPVNIAIVTFVCIMMS